MNGSLACICRQRGDGARTRSAAPSITVDYRDDARPVQGVVLELCGVLYDDSAWCRWLIHLVGRMGLQTHYAAFFRVWQREFQDDVWLGKREFWPALKDFLRSTGLTRGQVDEIEAASRGRFRVFDDDIRPFPGVADTLRRLSAAGVELAVTSRRPVRRIEIARLLSRLGVGDRIRHVVVAADQEPCQVGETRFHRLLERISCDAAHLAYVGRDPRDLQTASELGMLSVAFNHDADAQADLYLDQLDQLLSVVVAPPLLAAG